MNRLAIILITLLLPAPGWAGERADLAPNGKDWQSYPRDIRSAVVDIEGRAWLVSDRFVEWGKARKQVEEASGYKVPWLQGVRVLGTDRQGRIWLTDLDNDNILRAWNPEKKTWLTHKGKRPFQDGVFETRKGVIYIADLLGMHVLKDGAWTYQPLFERNIEKERYYSSDHEFNAPTLVEDGAGRVYLHARWGKNGWTGTMGYWAHSEKGWKQLERQGQRHFERLLGIMPLGEGSRFLVCPESQDTFWVDLFPSAPNADFRDLVTQLGAEKFRDREAASRELRTLGREHVAFLVKEHGDTTDPEIRLRLGRVLALCGQEFIDGLALRHVSPLRATGNGGWWFHADQTRTAKGEKDERGGIYHISPSGDLTKVSEPVGYPDAACVGPKGEIYLGTRTGSLLRGEVKAKEEAQEGNEQENLKLHAIEVPDYWNPKQLFGVDKNQRLYLRGRKGVAAIHCGQL